MPFSATQAEIVGELDHMWRPIIELQLVAGGQSHVLRCHVDTASDDALVFRSYQRALDYGVPFKAGPSAPRRRRRLANDVETEFLETMVSVGWFGGLKQVYALAPDPEVAPQLVVTPDLPIVLVGLPLLRDTEVGLRFDDERSVRIRNLKSSTAC